MIAAVLLVLVVGAGVWYINSGQFTTVPAVLDMTQEKAERTLRAEGLEVEVKRAFSPNVERGHVMATTPENGKRIRGTGTVTITLSKGPEIVQVPDLAGTPIADAKRKLRDLGLTVGTVHKKFSDEVAKGSVISTDPAAGSKRRPETAVALTVSRGAEVDVPDVTGRDRADAEATLRGAGFEVKIADGTVHSPHEKGKVARQAPGAGGKLGRGDTVTLTLSEGPEMVTVPDVTGKTADDARQALSDAGFEVEVKKPFLFPRDRVESQSVAGGGQAAKGSKITIRLESVL